jgi:hypothetical protein
MTTTRKQAAAPSFKPVESDRELKLLVDEIKKIRPLAEISLEGLSELAKGRILDWQPQRKIFTVEWIKKSQSFDELTEKSPGLRAYVKTQLFTTQLVFKSTTVRRVDDDHSHFRIPEQLFHQQQRGALRVPLLASQAILKTPQGEFMLSDLSVGGAKAAIPADSNLTAGLDLSPCQLTIGNLKIHSPQFQAKVARVQKGDASNIVGFKFSGLEDRHRSLIKQFLIDALKNYYANL